jgi:hypothetical protein
MASLSSQSSSTAAVFTSPGFGHIDPKVERGQLRKEIDAAMGRVDKLLKNKNIEAAERIRRVEDIKAEICEKKSRIAAIKEAARAEPVVEPTAPPPRELAPVEPPGSRSPRPAGPREPFSPNAASNAPYYAH